MKNFRKFALRFLFGFTLLSLLSGSALRFAPQAHALGISVDASTKYDPVKKQLTIVAKNGADASDDLSVKYATIDGFGHVGNWVSVTMPKTDNLQPGEKVTKVIPLNLGHGIFGIKFELEVCRYVGLQCVPGRKTLEIKTADLKAESLKMVEGKAELTIKNNGPDSVVFANDSYISVNFDYYNEQQGLLDYGGRVKRTSPIYIGAKTVAPNTTFTVTDYVMSASDESFVRATIVGFSQGSLADKDQNNNFRKIAIPRPMLKLDPASSYDPATQMMNIIIKNTGRGIANIPGNNSVYLHIFPSLTTGSRNNFTKNVASKTLKPGESFTDSFNYYPVANETGVKVLLATTTFREEADEHGELDIKFALPDLIIIDAKQSDDGKTIFATVQNSSVADAVTKGVLVYFYGYSPDGNGYYMGKASLPDKLVAKGTYGVSAPWNILPGTVYVGISVNIHDVYGGVIIEESDSGKRNNDYRYDFELPDLEAKLLFEKFTYTIQSNIKNVGKKATPAGVDIEMTFYKGTSVLQTFTTTTTSPIGLGGRGYFYYPIATIPEGTTSVEVIADKYNKIFESHKTDNREKIDIPQPAPDLEVTSLAYNNETGEATIGIKSIGKGDHDGVIKALARFDFEYNNIQEIPIGQLTLNKGDETTVTFKIQKPRTTTELWVFLRSSVETEITGNNYATMTILGTQSPENIIDDDLLGIGDKIAKGMKDASEAAILDPEKVAGILPDNPLHVFEDIGNAIDVGFTFDKEKKAEKLKDIANEKILETNILTDKGKGKAAKDSLNGYKDTMDQLTKVVVDVQMGDEKAGDEFINIVIGEQLTHLPVLDKLQAESEVDDSLSVKAKRDEVLDVVGKMAGKVKNPNKLKDALEKPTASKTPFAPLKDLVAINEITTHIASGKVRDVLLDAKERKEIFLNNNLGSLNGKQLKDFNEFVNKTTGDKVNTLKALEDVKSRASNNSVKVALSSSKKEVIESLAKDIKSSKGKKLKAGEGVLSDLEGGSITDLRVLASIQSKDSEVAGEVAATKKKSIDKLAKNIKGLKENEKQKYIDDITSDHLDLTQQAVVNDIKRALPQDKLGQDLDTALKTKVKEKVAKVKGNKKEYDEFLTEVSGDTSDDKAAINAFTSGFDQSFFKDLMRQQLTFMKSFYADADPDLKKVLDEYYFNDPQIKAFYTDFDSAFENIFKENYVETVEDEEEPSAEFVSDENYDDYESDAGTTSGCPMIDQPVCGQDGLNYANACEAKDNGTDVAYEGECSDESSYTEDNSGSEEQPEEEVQGASTSNIQHPWWHLLWPH